MAWTLSHVSDIPTYRDINPLHLTFPHPLTGVTSEEAGWQLPSRFK